MTELELYKFIKKYDETEINWVDDDSLFLWLSFSHLAEFTELVGHEYFCEGGETVTLLADCICINLTDICECDGIEPTNILAKETN